MPRPKIGRARTANNRGRPQRVAKNVRSVTREEVQQQLAKKKIGPVLSNSDDSDELVVAEVGLRNRRSIPRKEVYGSGGLGPGDKPSAHKKVQAAAKRKLIAAKGSSQASPIAIPKTTTSNAANVPNATMSQLTSRTTPLKPILKSPSVTSQAGSVAQNNSSSARPQNTPLERSFLAGLKPRPRQPSLLAGLKQNATNQDETELNIADLDEFDDLVPNDESTPLNSDKSRAGGVSSLSSQSSSTVAGRKRKITPVGLAVQPGDGARTRTISQLASPTGKRSIETNEFSTSRDSPALPRIMDQQGVDYDDDSINAPPQSSSSPVSSPMKAVEAPRVQPPSPKQKPTRNKTKAEASKMSTEALQALLPSRRGQEKAKLHTRGDQFDIPSDSSQEAQPTAIDQDEDELSYLPVKRQRKSTLKKAPVQKTAAKKSKGGKKQASGKDREAGETRKGPTPIKATPLKDVSTRAAAKTSLQQGKQKVTYSSHHQDMSEGDKENQPFDTSDAFSSPANLEVDGSENGAAPVNALRGSELERKKWAAIDAFDLDFEDMSPDGLASSSPTR